MLKRHWVALLLLGACVGVSPAAPARGKRSSPPARKPAAAGRRAVPVLASQAARRQVQARWHMQRGFQFYESRALREAAQQFRQVLRLQPHNAYAHLVLGDVYATQRSLEQAVAEYRAAIRLAPLDTRLHERLGITYERLDKPHLAASVYKNVIWIDARDATAHQHLGWALERQGRRQEAILAYQRALQLDPHFSIARARLRRLQPESPSYARRSAMATRRARG